METNVTKYRERRDKRVKERMGAETREDYGVKGMKWGEHKAEQEEEHSNARKAGKITDIKGNKVEYSDGDFAVCSVKEEPGLFYVYKKREFKGKPDWSVHGLWERSAKDGFRAIDDARGNITASSMKDILKKETGR